jgi:hypothetical protein
VIVVILIVLGVIVLAVAVLSGLTWLYGWDLEGRSAPARAGLVEAGERTADWMAEFRDWLRQGR